MSSWLRSRCAIGTSHLNKKTYLQFVVCYTLFGLRWKWNVRRVSTVNAMINVTVRSFLYVSVIREIENMMGHMARYNFDDCKFWLIRGKSKVVRQQRARIWSESTCDEIIRGKDERLIGSQSWIWFCGVNISVAKCHECTVWILKCAMCLCCAPRTNSCVQFHKGVAEV